MFLSKKSDSKVKEQTQGKARSSKKGQPPKKGSEQRESIGLKVFTELKDTALPKEEGEVRPAGFRNFHVLEYNLFWLLHLLIIFCTIYLVGGDMESCLNIFLQVINPMNWF